MSDATAIVWFRRDLRLTDHPALRAALAGNTKIIPVYIHDPENDTPWPPGSASRWWLHMSLARLGEFLTAAGSRLIIRRGTSGQALSELCRETGAGAVYWNRLPEPGARLREQETAKVLEGAGLMTAAFDSALLFDPEIVLNRDGAPFRRFTPFWRACLERGLATTSHQPPERLPPVPETLNSLTLGSLALMPTKPWYSGLEQNWCPGEKGALAALRSFCDDALEDYPVARDRPDLPMTSRLSPYLHFGEISPRQIVAEVLASAPVGANCAEVFLRELGWREFSHYLLHHFPQLPEAPLDERFNHFPWKQDNQALRRWQRGRTGIPLVDAGMRELWATGWMHNRVRMVVGSFLVKNLLIPWQAGARWFWDTLVDADLANNSQNWQWVAGCGADAAPYFRIFNPVLQGRKFDPEGRYVRQWVPELSGLPDPAVHAPWEASGQDLLRAGVELGRDYPLPVVDLKASRQRALAAFKRMQEQLL